MATDEIVFLPLYLPLTMHKYLFSMYFPPGVLPPFLMHLGAGAKNPISTVLDYLRTYFLNQLNLFLMSNMFCISIHIIKYYDDDE